MTDPLKDPMEKLLREHVERQIAWFNSPQMVELRERYRREWLARPWYERAWSRTKVKAMRARLRLGEIIAGRSFDD